MMSKRKTFFFTISIAFILAFYIGLKSFADRKAESLLEEAFHKLALYADISYQNVFVNLFGLNTHIKGVTITPTFQVDRDVPIGLPNRDSFEFEISTQVFQIVWKFFERSDVDQTVFPAGAGDFIKKGDTDDRMELSFAESRSKLKFARKVMERGGMRITEIGKMNVYDYPWDGIFPMSRFVRWVSLDE